jgi:hypothetical protein
VANTLRSYRKGAVGFIVWLDLLGHLTWVIVEYEKLPSEENMQNAGQMFHRRNCADSRLLFLAEFLTTTILHARTDDEDEEFFHGINLFL